MRNFSIARLEIQEAVIARRMKEHIIKNMKQIFKVVAFGQTRLLFSNEQTVFIVDELKQKNVAHCARLVEATR